MQPGCKLGVAGVWPALWGAAMAVTVGAGSVPAFASDAVVRPGQRYQRITGFGASSAWTAASMSDGDADLLFTVDKGVGFNLLRVRIPPTGCTPPESCELATAQKAQARGATVWATPWSPRADWKSNGDVNDGGTLLPAHAVDWANALVSFVQWMNSRGVTISYVSAQNEPTMNVSYESCIYTPLGLADFIGNDLAPAFASAGLSTKIMGPETEGWGDFPRFAGAILGTPAASSGVAVVATHSYGSNRPAAYAPALQAGKEVWQTEVADPQKTRDPGIASALRVASMMHAALVDANVNAWHYWWIYPLGSDNQGLWDQPTSGSRVPAKRLYAMGNFSRFVRPGFYRVETTATPSAQVLVSAYYEPQSTQLVIVAINASTAAVSQRFLFDGVTAGSWTPWVTSADSDLSTPADPGLDDGGTADGGGSPPDADGGTGGDAGPSDLVYVLPPQSVTTLQVTITGPGPAVPRVVSTTSPMESGNSGVARPGGADSGCACSAVGSRMPEGFALSLGAGGVAGAFAAALARRRRRERARRD